MYDILDSMTGRTHDLVAFTALNFIVATQQNVPQMTFATAFVAFGANMIGGLLPDIDDKTADIWDKIRGGSLLARIVKPLIGGHRMMSHSLIGMAIVGYLSHYTLQYIGTVLLVDINIVWWALMIGYMSHLVADSLTTEGVPWLLPVPIRFGFPPLKTFRIKTGGIAENAIVFPGLLALNGYMFFTYYPVYLQFFRSLKG